MSLANALSTAIPADGKPNLLSGAALEDSLKASAALYDLVEVSAAEIKPHVPSVPQTDYHVRVELENGTDRYLSFDAHFIRETDEATGDDVEYYDLYNLHLDGRPCTVDDVNGLFEGGLERLGQWVWQQGGGARMSVYLIHIEPPLGHARHYVGWTIERTVDRRVNEHLAGGCKASPMIVAALLAGRTVTLARRWEGDQYDRAFERKLKERGGKSRAQRCPFCGAQRRQANP